MKLYSDYAHATIQMQNDESLRTMLQAAITEYTVHHVLETGTCEGLGSTRIVADCFTAKTWPRQFVTIEANWRMWRRARKNLAQWPFVTCLWGYTVPVAEAVAFIKADTAIQHHEQFPNFFIDDIVDPISFYVHECQGEPASRLTLTSGLQKMDRLLHHSGDHLLAEWLQRMQNEFPLVILDSAGGIGWLEFQYVMQYLQDVPFLLLLDDIVHLKHFRSIQTVRENPHFQILGESVVHGWALAVHQS